MPLSNRSVKIAAALSLAHFAALLCFFAPAISTPDANSYFAQTRLLATTGAASFVPESPVQFIGPHWRRGSGGRYYCTHAPGLPAVAAVPYRLFGPTAALLVSPIAASLTLFGLFLLGAAWLGAEWGLLAAALMAANSFANEHALFGDAHTLAAFLLVWSLVLVERCVRKPSPLLAVAAGALAGLLPAVRYPEAVFLPALAVYAWRSMPGSRGQRGAALAGLLLPLVALAARNHAAYGAIWRTGYAATGEQSAFGLWFLARNAVPFLLMLVAVGAGPALLLGAVGVRDLWRRPETRRRAQLIAGIAVPTTLLYASYYWPPDPQSMRFLIPTFFLYALAAACFLERYVRERPDRRRAALTAALAAAALWGLPRSFLTLAHLKWTNAAVARATALLDARAERGAVVVAPFGLQQHLDFVGRWRLAAPPRDAGPEEFAAAARSWAGTGGLYVLAKEKDLRGYDALLAPGERFDRIGETRLVDAPFFLPEPPEPEGAERLGPMGPDRIFDLKLDAEPLVLLRRVRG